MRIKEGSIITGPLWAEPVIVKLIDNWQNCLRIIGKTKNTYSHIDQLLTEEDLEKIVVNFDGAVFSE